MIHVSAPGKLFIAGEWSVLEPGNAAIVGAVNKRSHAQISEMPSDGPQTSVVLSIEEFGIVDKRAQFDGKQLLFTSKLSAEEQQRLAFIKSAIEVALQYVRSQASLKSFSLRTSNEYTVTNADKETKRVSFGPGTAAIVATIASIFELHGLHLERHREQIYKTAVLAYYNIYQTQSSCYDVVASTYGGVSAYIAPNFTAVRELSKTTTIKKVVDGRWSLLNIQPLEVPEDFCVAVGLTKNVSDTQLMLQVMDAWKVTNNGQYSSMVERISESVDRLLQAWRLKDRQRIIELVKKNRAALTELTQLSGIPVETEDFRKLAEIADENGAAGKPIGIGGGRGIAVCFDSRISENVKVAWQSAGLFPLDVELDRQGVRVEKK